MGTSHARRRDVIGDISLTERELEVLLLKARRRTNAEIAEQLYISLTTVKWHVRQIYNKLGANNRAEAITYARQLGILAQKAEQTQQPHDNSPIPLTPFIGREQEISYLTTTLVDSESRLVTVTGPGGMGKTRLALQVAKLVNDHFVDGVCWVTFSAQDNAEYVFTTAEEYIAVAISAALELSPQGGEDPKRTLVPYLREKKLLIILDGFEHLLSGSLFISEVLADAPVCRFLITSRERLNIPGEVLYTIKGLKISPDENEEPEAMDAVKLFLQATGRISNHSLKLTALSSIRRICLRLEGMPLAIELAADWMRMLPVADIEQELNRGLEFLGTSTSDMRTVINRSWNLLNDDQRISFARLAVFQSSFTHEAAHQVTGTDLYTLSTLFDKSLIQRIDEDRFSVHDLLRQFAAEQLTGRGESGTIRDAHCAYFATLAAGQMESLYRGDHRVMLADLDNLRSAWRWAVKGRRLEDLRKMLFPLDWFYNLRANYVEGEAAMRLAVDALHMQDPEGLQGIVYGKALASYGLEHSRTHGADQAMPAVSKALAILRNLGAREDLAWPQLLSVFENVTARDPLERERRCLESLDIFEEIGNPYGMAFSLGMLGAHYRQQGRYGEAQLSIERGLAVSRSLGDQEGIAFALRNLGHLNLHQGRYELACSNFEEEYVLWCELSLPRLASEALSYLGETYLAVGDFKKAEELLQESLAEFEQLGDEGNALTCLLDLGQLAWQVGQPQKARGLLRESRPILERRNDSKEQTRWWQLSGRVYLQQGELETAQLAFDRALEHSLSNGGIRFIETLLDFALLYKDLLAEEKAAYLLGFALAQTGLPASLVQWRIEPLRESLESITDDNKLALLLVEGARLNQQAIINNLEA